jgi:hypothetical protein
MPEQISTLLSERFVEFLGLMLTLLSGWAINSLRLWLKTKAGIELSESQERRLREIAADAIDAAEELAHQKVKDGGTVTSEDKLQMAASHLRKRAKVERIAQEKVNGGGIVEDRIHTELGRRRSMPPPPPTGAN